MNQPFTVEELQKWNVFDFAKVLGHQAKRRIIIPYDPYGDDVFYKDEF